MSAKRDALLCLLPATVLVGTAVAIVFGLRPGGFETQIGWFYGLLPGALPAQIIAFKLAPDSRSSISLIVEYGLGLSLTFAWYFVLCFGALRGWRWWESDE